MLMPDTNEFKYMKASLTGHGDIAQFYIQITFYFKALDHSSISELIDSYISKNGGLVIARPPLGNSFIRSKNYAVNGR